MKRSRSDAFGSKNVKRAIAINAKLRSRYPYKDYGTGYFRRGTAENLARFGSTFKAANPAQRTARRSMGYIGQGMYMGGRGGYWGRKIGGLFGKADLGDKLGDIGSGLVSQFVPGGATAMMAARAAGRVFSGQGEYTANNLVAGGDPIPSFSGSPDGSTVRISHREYIGDVFAPPVGSTFANNAFSVNPGIERTFPWLSQIAQNYDEYTIHQLMFSYRSTVSDFAASSGQIGQVIMATIYNAASEPFSDKAAMMQYDSSMSSKTSESMVHGVECDPAKLSGSVGRFVRSNPVLVGQDINQYDHGLFNVAVTETPASYANQAMGELWISYTVELRKPKFFVNRGLGISRDVFVATQVGLDSKAPFGYSSNPSALLLGQQNNIGTSLIQNDQSEIPTGLSPVNGDWNDVVPTGPSTPGIPCAFRVVFPGNYTGNLRVALSMTGSFQGYYAAYAQGNIKPINDVMGTTAALWKSWSTGGKQSGEKNMVLYFDIRVDNATGGVDNTLWFTGYMQHSTTDTTFLDISEYNLGLSYKLDGTRDQLILVDKSGTVQNI